MSHLLHGGQRFVWGAPMHAGDEITTTATFAAFSDRAGLQLYGFEAVSVNQAGATVATGTWDLIVRPAEAAAT